MRSDRTMCWRHAWWIGVTLGSLLVLGPGDTASARGQDAPSSHADKEAHALFERVADGYKLLTSYSDEGRFVAAMTIGGKARREVRPLRMTFIRPNKLDLDASSVRLISDGKALTTVVKPLKKYLKSPAPETIGIDTFREGATGPLLFGGPAAAPTFVLLNLIAGTAPDVLLDRMGGTVRAVTASGGPGERRTLAAGSDDAALVIDLREGPDLLLRVDPATKLLLAIELKIDPAQLARGTLPGQTPSIEQFGWMAGAISTRVPADRPFAFVAPREFTPTADLKAQPGGTGSGPKYAVEETIGNAAPDFRFTLLDGPGKTRTVTRRDLAGKVVVIDFWATWCGPCIVELPEIRRLVDHYNGTKEDVVVVALSQDMLPEDVPALRQLVEKTLADKGIDLTAGPVGRIGLDPSNAVGRAFNIEGFPSVVILDRKGIVRSAYVGYRSDTTLPLHQSLAREIDALLAGK